MQGHRRPDPMQTCIGIPTIFPLSGVIGLLKGSIALSIARNFMGGKEDFTGETFWARGYFVSTVGLDEEAVRKNIEEQEQGCARAERLHRAGTPQITLSENRSIQVADRVPSYHNVESEMVPGLPGWG